MKLELKHQNLFLQAYRKHYLKKKCHGVKQNAKKCAIGELECNEIEVFILGGQRIDQKRKKGWGEGEERGLRIEIERKETKGN